MEKSMTTKNQKKNLYEDGRVARNEFYRVCPNCGYIWIIEENDMKNVGEISIDFTKDDGGYGIEIRDTLNGIPGKVIAKALVTLVANIARDNKWFMDTFIYELGKLVGLEDETEDD